MKLSAAFLAAGLAACVPAAHALEPSDVRWGGLLDVAAAGHGGGYDLNRLNRGNTAFDAYRLRLFLETRPQPALQVHAQVFCDDVTGPIVFGAYLDFAPAPERDFHLLAGKIPSPLGTYAPRTYSDEKPLVGTPMIHQYHSTLRPDLPPPDADALLAVAGTGNGAVAYAPGAPGFHGMPILYDHCWDFGALLVGSARPVEFAAGLTYGTPSAPQTVRDGNRGQTWMGRVGLQLGPALRLGVSGARGPYLPSPPGAPLPAGRSPEDYAQRLLMADAALSFGRLDLIAEAARNRWETPTVGDLDVDGWYVEGKLGVGASAYVATRWDALRFSEITPSSGGALPWDADVDRWESGVGYRLAQDALVKVVYQHHVLQPPAGRRTEDLAALQLSLRFR